MTTIYGISVLIKIKISFALLNIQKLDLYVGSLIYKAKAIVMKVFIGD